MTGLAGQVSVRYICLFPTPPHANEAHMQGSVEDLLVFHKESHN